MFISIPYRHLINYEAQPWHPFDDQISIPYRHLINWLAQAEQAFSLAISIPYRHLINLGVQARSCSADLEFQSLIGT